MNENVATVQAIYTAFAQGDVASICARVDPHVEWEYGHGELEVAYLRPRRGPDGVGAFFASLAENLQVSHLRVKEVLATDGLVVALVDLEARSTRTGRVVREEDEVHVWRFGPDGKVVRFKHALDSAQHAAAWRA